MELNDHQTFLVIKAFFSAMMLLWLAIGVVIGWLARGHYGADGR